jgi:hypothetical protein
MRDYYFDMIQTYKELTHFEEHNYPMIKYVDKMTELAHGSNTTPVAKILIKGSYRRLNKAHDPAHYHNFDLEDVLWSTLSINPETGKPTPIDPIIKRTISKHHHL